MNKAAFISLLLGLFSWSNLAFANDLVQFPTGAAAWTVDVKGSQFTPDSPYPTPANQKKIVTIAVTQDERKRVSLITWNDGPTTERWDIPGQHLVLAEDAQGHAFSLLPGMGVRNTAIPFVADSFSWLSPEYLQEKDPITYKGKLCYHYKGFSDPRDQIQRKYSQTVRAEAWIDSQTLLPVALDDGSSFGIYTFQKDPPAPFTLPAKFQDTYNRYEQAMGVMKQVTL